MAVDLTQTIGQNVQTAQQYSTSALENKLQKTDYKNAKDDELMEAVKSFESYFVEQVIKEVEKTIHTEESDSYAAQMTDYFKDSVIQELSDKIIDQSGNSYAQKLYEQMRRNYGISDAEITEDAAEKAAGASETDPVAAVERTAGSTISEEDEVEVTVLDPDTM